MQKVVRYVFENVLRLKKIGRRKKYLLPLIWMVKSPEILVHPSKSLKLSRVRMVLPGHSLEQSAHSCNHNQLKNVLKLETSWFFS